jgi:hypothetical protein
MSEFQKKTGSSDFNYLWGGNFDTDFICPLGDHFAWPKNSGRQFALFG